LKPNDYTPTKAAKTKTVFDLGAAGSIKSDYDRVVVTQSAGGGIVVLVAFQGSAFFEPPVRLPPEPPLTLAVENSRGRIFYSVFNPGISYCVEGSTHIVLTVDQAVEQ